MTSTSRIFPNFSVRSSSALLKLNGGILSPGRPIIPGSPFRIYKNNVDCGNRITVKAFRISQNFLFPPLSAMVLGSLDKVAQCVLA